MKRSPTARLLTGLSAAALATTGIALAGPAHAVSTQGFLSYVDGWRVGQHVRELADVNGDGRADVVAFGDPGVFVAHGQANGTFAAPVPFGLNDWKWAVWLTRGRCVTTTTSTASCPGKVTRCLSATIIPLELHRIDLDFLSMCLTVLIGLSVM